MRVLSVHNRYRQRGGEDHVFDAEVALLEHHGHNVHRLEFSNRDISSSPGPRESFRLAISTIWSKSSAEEVRVAARDAGAEVVHFTNTFPLASPSVYSAARSTGAAVVRNVQNYRMICPNATLYRDNHVCHDCVGKTIPWPGVVHACYHDSRLQTSVVGSMIAVHKMRKTWQTDIDAFIAATHFSRQRLIEGGLPPDKIFVKPNFLDPAPQVKTEDGDHCLFVGRLSAEKGIATLLSAWTEQNLQISLRLAGSGPLESAVRSTGERHGNIEVLGSLPSASVMDEMRRARLLVFPSVWYEGLPVTLVEAFASGLPVVASRLGAMAEIIEDGCTGLLFTPGDERDLAAKIRWALEHPDQLRTMGEAARQKFETSYTADANYATLMDIYRRAIDRAHRS